MFFRRGAAAPFDHVELLDDWSHGLEEALCAGGEAVQRVPFGVGEQLSREALDLAAVGVA